MSRFRFKLCSGCGLLCFAFWWPGHDLNFHFLPSADEWQVGYRMDSYPDLGEEIHSFGFGPLLLIAWT